MTVPPIEVQALWDGTRLTAGVTGATDDLNKLAAATDVASQDISTSLEGVGTTATTEFGTTVPAAVDASAVGLTTKSAKFKAVGTELGTSLAQGVGAGVSAPEAAAGAAQSVSSLLAVTAKTGVGIAAAVGLGLGVAIVKGLVGGAAERKQEVIDAYNDLFEGIEVTAESSARKIRQSIIDAFTFETALKEFGGGDIDEAFRRIEELATLTGEDMDDIASIIQVGITPATKDAAQSLAEIAGYTFDMKLGTGQTVGIMAEQSGWAKRILDSARDTTAEQDKLLEQKLIERDAQRIIAGDSNRAAANMGDMAATSAVVAANTERAAYAAERLGAAVGSAARAAATLALDLGT